MTLAIPADLRNSMEKFPEMNWSEVARQAIAEKVRILSEMQRLFAKSVLTEDDALRLGRTINKRAWKKHGKK
jgi:hypothetical protein